MPRKYIKPSSNSASMQIFSGIIGLVIILSVASKYTRSGEAFLIIIFFVLVCLGSIIIGFVNMFSKTGIPTQEIVTEEDETTMNEPPTDVEARLRRLVRLHEDKLISDEEFTRKRAEILNERS